MRAEGKSWGELLMNAAKGLRALWGLAEGGPERVERLGFTADTPEDLLVVFLEELVYRLSARGEVWAGGRVVEAGPKGLTVDARWRVLGASESPKLDVKAATYQGLRVKKSAGRLSATILFDV